MNRKNCAGLCGVLIAWDQYPVAGDLCAKPSDVGRLPEHVQSQLPISAGQASCQCDDIIEGDSAGGVCVLGVRA